MSVFSEIASIIQNSKFLTVFTGAGISRESGIPVFRGNDGIYSKYDQSLLTLKSYLNNTEKSWKAVKEIFYDFFIESKPNIAHYILASWEEKGIIKYIITQNIDNLHQEAGSRNVIEYHGTKNMFTCLNCGAKFSLCNLVLNDNPPECKKCKKLLKPDIVFFGESIPRDASEKSYNFAKTSDVLLIIGTTGTVQPASYIPKYAKSAGAIIIEINPEPSVYTDKISDYYLPYSAGEALSKINENIK
ncbi:MAG: NAD-dependent protein deacylase [Bacteroidales bacterium]